MRATDTLYATTAQFNILKAPTTSGGTDFGIGTAGSVLKTGANGVYWAADSQGVTSVRVQATSPVVSSTNTAQTSTLNTTISLSDAYGDTKNPYGTKTPNYVLAGPSSGTTAAAPSFRTLVAADIPDLSATKITSDTLSVERGGTGAGTFTSGAALIGNGTGAITTRSITNNTSATAVTASTNLITANTLYYHKGNSNIVTVGTITSGTWNAGALTSSGSLTLKSTSTNGDVGSRWIYAGVTNDSTWTNSANTYNYTAYSGTWSSIRFINRHKYIKLADNSITWQPSRIQFRQYSATANSGTRLEYYEEYRLPNTTDDLTANKNYDILTTKSAVTVAQGGTGTTTAPTQGGVIYASSTSAYASTAAGTSGQYLKSNGTSAPTWASFSASTVGLGNVTNAAQITKATFTKAYQLMYSTAASTPAVLDANTTTTKKFLTMTGTGSAGASPSWGTLAAADIPDISSTYLKLTGGTISGNLITQKFIRPVVTGSGTAAVTSSPYKPALWKFNLATATPTEGDIITITVPVAGHSNGVFVSTDNGTTYKPVSLNGTTKLTTHYPVGTTISLVYDADGATNTVYPVAGDAATTNVTGGCWRVLNYYDSGNDTSSIYSFGGASRQAETSANGGIGLWRYSLQLMTTNRKWSSIAYNTSATETNSGTTTNKSVSTASFLLDAPILYQDTNTKVNAGSSGNVNGRTAVSFDMRYNTTNAKWSNLTIQMPVFLVGTVNNDGATFKLDTTQWWTQTLPSSNDGKIYILLGYASSTTAVYLLTYHPIYYHNGTNVVPYVVKVLDVAHGGTGATTAANARTNLGLGSVATLDVWGSDPSTYSTTKVLIPKIKTDGVMEIGRFIDFHISSDTANDYDFRLTAGQGGLDFSMTAGQYGYLTLIHTDGIGRNTLYVDTNNSQIFFRAAPKSTNDPNNIYEDYWLPAPTINSGQAEYTILTTKPFAGNIIINSTGYGLYLTDNNSKRFAGIVHNGNNLWIGSQSATTRPITGTTQNGTPTGRIFINTGYNVTAQKPHPTIYITQATPPTENDQPNPNADSNWTYESFEILHSGNFADHTTLNFTASEDNLPGFYTTLNKIPPNRAVVFRASAGSAKLLSNKALIYSDLTGIINHYNTSVWNVLAYYKNQIYTWRFSYTINDNLTGRITNYSHLRQFSSSEYPQNDDNSYYINPTQTNPPNPLD